MLRTAALVLALVALAGCAAFRAPALVVYGEVGLRRRGEDGVSGATRTELGAALVLPLDDTPRAPRPLRDEPRAPAIAFPAAPCRIDTLCRWERVERERALARLRAQLER